MLYVYIVWVRYKAFKQFGLKDVEIREFFNGPAYLTWSRGQSMQTVGTGKSVNSTLPWTLFSMVDLFCGGRQ